MQKHRDWLTGELGEPHPHERRIAIVAPSLDPADDAALRVDQEGDRYAADPAVGRANRLIAIEDHRQVIELLALDQGSHVGGSILQ